MADKEESSNQQEQHHRKRKAGDELNKEEETRLSIRNHIDISHDKTNHPSKKRIGLSYPSSSYAKKENGNTIDPHKHDDLIIVSKDSASSQNFTRIICPICLDMIKESSLTPNCGHSFCLSCITEHSKSSPYCPVCSKEIVWEKATIAQIHIDGVDVDNIASNSSILETAKKLITVNKNIRKTNPDTLPLSSSSKNHYDSQSINHINHQTENINSSKQNQLPTLHSHFNDESNSNQNNYSRSYRKDVDEMKYMNSNNNTNEASSSSKYTLEITREFLKYAQTKKIELIARLTSELDTIEHQLEAVTNGILSNSKNELSNQMSQNKEENINSNLKNNHIVVVSDSIVPEEDSNNGLVSPLTNPISSVHPIGSVTITTRVISLSSSSLSSPSTEPSKVNPMNTLSTSKSIASNSIINKNDSETLKSNPDNSTQRKKSSSSTMKNDKFKQKFMVYYPELESSFLYNEPTRIQDIIDHLHQFPFMKCVASFSQIDSSLNSMGTNNLISALELDNRDKLLATAGVSKRIQLYDVHHIRKSAAVSSSKNGNLKNKTSYEGDEEDDNDYGGYYAQNSQRSFSAKLRRRSTFNRQYSSSSLFSALQDANEALVHLEGFHRSGSNINDDESNEFDNSSSFLNTNNHITPLLDIPCKTKFSSLSWNVFNEQMLSSADYEGLIQLWDTSTGQHVMKLEEHDKRAWTVEFSPTQRNILASGSDDFKVKIWSCRQRKSIVTIQSKASVCSVAFCPVNPNYFSFGSADHSIYCYDMRYTKDAIVHLTGHAKSVSYVKYFNSKTLVSASTDSSLHTWTLPFSYSSEDSDNVSSKANMGNRKSNSSTPASPSSLTAINSMEEAGVTFYMNKIASMKRLTSNDDKIFKGHSNEKNFVGLAVNKHLGYLATGSEDNSVYIYSKDITKPWIVEPLGVSIDFITGRECPENGKGMFVSSVAWGNHQQDLLIAGNSAGRIKFFERDLSGF